MADNGKRGIDVSKWNVITDYDAVKKGGVQFAIVRALQGSKGVEDPMFQAHVDGFKSAGIPIIAAYNYAYYTKDFTPIVDAFIERCIKNGINQVELDLEDKSMAGLGTEILKIINIYRRRAEKANLQFGIYTGAQFYNPHLKQYVSEIKDIPIWWARYPYVSERTIDKELPSTTYLPQGIPLEGWQYSSNCIVPGINGRVDVNVWWDMGDFTNNEETFPVCVCMYPEPARTLYRGSKGDDVRWVQWYLWRFGCLLDKAGKPNIDEIDGIFGARTQAATLEAQRRLQMPMTGYVATSDRAIWKKLV